MVRKERTIKNSFSAVLKFAVRLILQFVLRTIIIYKLGVDYVGIDSLFANVISMLSLAELGIGSAIVFSMYKPAAENDIEKLKSLNSLYKKIYGIITLIVLVIGLSILPFVEFFVNGKPKVDVDLKLVYIIFLLNTVVSYLGAHKRSLLFAFQRNDIENNIVTIQLILMSLVQIVVLLVFNNYYVYVVMIPLFTLIEVLMVVWKANKMFPEIRGKAQPLDVITKKQITKNIIATSCHKLGSVVVMSTDNLLISKFFGLTALGTISNYILIYSAIHSLIKLLINAMQASVGNLIATTDKVEVMKFYKMVNWAFGCIAGFCAICMMCLYQPFISIWVGDTGYSVTIWFVLALVVRFYLTEMRQVTDMFLNCAGLMWYDRFKPLFEAVINIFASILFIKLVGVEGVFIGTIISTIAAPLWVEPYVLYKHYFKQKSGEYFIKLIIYSFVTLVAGSIAFFVCSLLPASGLIWLVVKLLICCAVVCVIYLLAYFKTQYFKQATNILKNTIKKK